MFFFIFTTIYLNEALFGVEELEGLHDILLIPGAALLFFTVFFINYAHKIFIKRRKKEFSLLMTLGMSNRDLLKLILLENGCLAILALASGLTAGAIFSRLFFMLLMNSVGLKMISFHISFEMLVTTITAYLIVFVFTVAMTIYNLLSKSLTESLKSDRYVENLKYRSPVIGGLGIILLVGTAVLFYITAINQGQDSGTYFFIWTSGIIMGLYITLSQCMSFLVDVAKRYPSFYFPRVLFFSSIENKFRNLTSILVLVSIMSMVTIFFTSFTFFLIKYQEKELVDWYPNDISFVRTEWKNNISDEELNRILTNPNNPLITHEELRAFLYIVKDQNYPELDYEFMPLSDFNRISNEQIELADEEYLYFINMDSEYAYVQEYLNNGIQLMGNAKVLEYSIDDIYSKRILNEGGDYLILTDKEFERIKNEVTGLEYSIQILNVQGWKDSAQIVEELKSRLSTLNSENLREIPQSLVDANYWYEVNSRIQAYNNTIFTNGIIFFVTIFICVLFFFGTFILLYLNVISNTEEEKRRFQKLYKIGITRKEFRLLLSRELGMIFFFAPIIGSCLAFVYILTFGKDGGGLLENISLLYSYLSMSGLYLIIQVYAYLYARKKLFEQVM